MKLGFTTLAVFMNENNEIIDLAQKHDFEIIEGVITLHLVVDDVTYPNHPIAHVTADVDLYFSSFCKILK